MKFSGALFAILLSVAATAPLSDAMADACDNAGGGQAGLNECYGKVFKKADAELNKRYKEIESRLADDADTKKQLITAQRAWVAYRDAECGFRASGGGSVAPMTYLICQTDLTHSRIQDFRNFLNCEEGDLTCPVPAAN